MCSYIFTRIIPILSFMLSFIVLYCVVCAVDCHLFYREDAENVPLLLL